MLTLGFSVLSVVLLGQTLVPERSSGKALDHLLSNPGLATIHSDLANSHLEAENPSGIWHPRLCDCHSACCAQGIGCLQLTL
jgi:hypothetical protein